MQVLWYCVRWLFALFCMEFVTSTICVWSLAQNKMWSYLSTLQGVYLDPVHYAVTAFWVIVIMWLKVGGHVGATEQYNTVFWSVGITMKMYSLLTVHSTTAMPALLPCATVHGSGL